MIRIAICDDERIYADMTKDCVEQSIENLGFEYEIDVFRSAALLLNSHQIKVYDVLFLDIDMPRMSGFELAKEIRITSDRSFIIFVTSKNELVYSSFEYQPFGFICKSDNMMQRDINKVINRLARFLKQNKLITVKDNYVMHDIPIRKIVFIQSEKHYLFYTTIDDNGEVVRERNTISEREKMLSEYDFIKLHSRFLVNATHIRNFDIIQNTIVMDNGTKIPVSKSCKADAIEKFRQFKRR